MKQHNKVHPFPPLSCTLLALLPPSPLPSRLTQCNAFIPKVSKVLFSLNTKHYCLLNFWWWLKSKGKSETLSIKTSQTGFRCSSPELHPYSKGLSLPPSSKLFRSTYWYGWMRESPIERLINIWQRCGHVEDGHWKGLTQIELAIGPKASVQTY